MQPEPLRTSDERNEKTRWRNIFRFQYMDVSLTVEHTDMLPPCTVSAPNSKLVIFYLDVYTLQSYLVCLYNLLSACQI